jgi:predicted RND superfamily exporter protein
MATRFGSFGPVFRAVASSRVRPMRAWQRLSAVVTRHPVRVLVGAGAVVAVLGVGLPRLEFTTGQDTLVDPASEVYRDNAQFQDRFGGEPMLVPLTGDIREMATGGRLDEIAALERDLRATGEFDAVVGPATALDFAVGQVSIAPGVFAAAAERDAAAAAGPAPRRTPAPSATRYWRPRRPD